MPRARIQGEIHTSRRDKSRLAQRLTGVDAVLRESMAQSFTSRRDPFYLLLFVGMKLYRHTLQRLLYASPSAVFDVAREDGVAVHRIDIAVDDWSDRIGDGKKGFLAGFSGLIAYGTVAGVRPVWLQVAAGVVAFIMLFFLYAALLTIPERDALMVEHVQEIAEEEGYETVLLSVGDAHVDGIADRLRDAGWTVETHVSRTLFGRILRPFMKFIKRL